jgi:hypothetical protein
MVLLTTDGAIVYKQILRSVKLTTGKKGKKIEWTGRGPLRRRRSAMDCSATEEEEEEGVTGEVGDNPHALAALTLCILWWGAAK